MKKPRPATIEALDKLVYMYRFCREERQQKPTHSPEWRRLSTSMARLYDDIMETAGISMSRADRIINGETTWQELWDATKRTGSTLPNAQQGEKPNENPWKGCPGCPECQGENK